MSTVMVTGQTSVSLYFYGYETSTGKLRDGTAASAIAYNTAGLVIQYVRERGAAAPTAAVTLASGAAAWAAGGFLHVGGGLYRVDYPDAAFVTGVKFVIPTVYGPSDTSVVFAGLTDLTGVDPRSASVPDVNVTTILGTAPTLTGGRMDVNMKTITAAVIAAASFAANALDAAWVAATRTLTAASDSAGTATLLTRITGLLPVAADYSTARAAKLDNLDAAVSSRGTSTYAGGDTAGTTTLLTRNNPLDAPGVRSALGMASANMDTQLDALPTNAELTAALNTLMTSAIAESYAADGVTMTPAQALYEIRGLLSEFSISGVTMTVRRKDGSTPAATYTLDSASAPTAITRAS